MSITPEERMKIRAVATRVGATAMGQDILRTMERLVDHVRALEAEVDWARTSYAGALEIIELQQCIDMVEGTKTMSTWQSDQECQQVIREDVREAISALRETYVRYAQEEAQE